MTITNQNEKRAEIVAADGCYLRLKGTTGNADNRRASVAVADIDQWEDAPLQQAEAADDEDAYKAEVRRLIRQRYSVDDELALHRKMQSLQLPPWPPTRPWPCMPRR